VNAIRVVGELAYRRVDVSKGRSEDFATRDDVDGRRAMLVRAIKCSEKGERRLQLHERIAELVTGREL